MPMSVRVFLSIVSDEFRPYRDQLRIDLTRPNVEVKVQEDFKDLGGDTLDKLDVYIAHCDAVVHLIGDMNGAEPGGREQRALLAKYPDLPDQLPPLGDALEQGFGISYTQWEAWLALYHGKLLLTAKAEDAAIRAGQNIAPTPESRASQLQHLARLEAVRRYPGFAFASPVDLAKQIASKRDSRPAGEGLLRASEGLAKTGRATGRRGLHSGNGQAGRGRSEPRFRGHETSGAQRDRDLRARDQRRTD